MLSTHLMLFLHHGMIIVNILDHSIPVVLVAMLVMLLCSKVFYCLWLPIQSTVFERKSRSK